jgi:hypothetical protein
MVAASLLCSPSRTVMFPVKRCSFACVESVDGSKRTEARIEHGPDLCWAFAQRPAYPQITHRM